MELRKHCGKVQKKNHWVDEFQKRITEDVPSQPPSMFPTSEDVSMIKSPICKTSALLAFYWISVDRCRSDEEKSLILSFLGKSSQRACSVITSSADGVLNFENANDEIAVDPLGRVFGFQQILDNCHQTVQKMLATDWDEQYLARRLFGPFRAASHNLVDIITFVSTCERRRRAKGRPVSKACHLFLRQIRLVILEWMGPLLEAYVWANYGEGVARADRGPPSLKYRRNGSTRSYVVVKPESAFDIIEKARAARTNLSQAVALKSDEDQYGCDVSIGDTWLQKMLQMYYKRCEFAFAGGLIHHINLVADPGTHSYKDCLVSVGYAWEVDLGCYPIWQHLLPGKHLTPTELDMPEDIENYAAKKKLERVSSFRQLQGYSNQLRWLRKDWNIDGFDLPDNCHVRAVAADEKRKAEVGAEQDTVYLVKGGSGERTKVLPTGLLDVPLLVVMLDQGSIGAAGMAFAIYFMQKMIHAKFDKIHRLIRDIKQAEKHCLNGVFNKAKLWSAYLYSLNKRPFGSGCNATLKKRMLGIFKDVIDIHAELFLKYLPRLSEEWGMPCDTPREREDILEKVFALPSFHQQLGHPKLQNWFAWNKCAKEQMPEFFATKMVFESQVAGVADPDASGTFEMPVGADPRQQLKAILQNGGGLPLAYRLMRTDLQDHVQIMWVAEKACWDWYTKEVKETQSPKHAVAYDMRLAHDRWMSEPHLWNTLQFTLFDPQYLRQMQIPIGDSSKATKALFLAWHIVSQRAWTLSKHSCPPESNANILSSNIGAATVVAERMKQHHTNFLSLEAKCHTVPDCMLLWKEILFLQSRPVRLSYEFYKRDKYLPSSPAGRKLMAGLLSTMPDNKVVEDVHHPLRLDSKANSNKRLSKNHVQDIIVHSGVLESRGVPNRAKVGKDVFVREVERTRLRKTADKHECRKHKLPKKWSRILHPFSKPWPALNEDSIRKSAAAWNWLHRYCEERGSGLLHNVGIGAARLSKLMVACIVVRQKSTDLVLASLGNATWGALALPLAKVELADEAYYKLPWGYIISRAT